jgi:hypothetical protein
LGRGPDPDFEAGRVREDPFRGCAAIHQQ